MSLLDDMEMKELAFDIAMSLLDDLLNGVMPDENASVASAEYLAWMATKITENSAVMDVDKAHRWIGYIQGVAIVTSLTNLDTERERVSNLREAILTR